MQNKETLEQLQKWQDIVSNNETIFESEFCEKNELLSLSFNSERFYVHYLTKEGMHISNSFPINKFLDFLFNRNEI